MNEKSVRFEYQLLINSWSQLQIVSFSESFNSLGISFSLQQVRNALCETYLTYLSVDWVLVQIIIVVAVVFNWRWKVVCINCYVMVEVDA